MTTTFTDVIENTFNFIKSNDTTVTNTSLFNFVNNAGIELTQDNINKIITDKFGTDVTSFTKTQFTNTINNHIDSNGLPTDDMIKITFKVTSGDNTDLSDETKFDEYYNYTNPGKLTDIKNKMVELSEVTEFKNITEPDFKIILDKILNPPTP